jgi:hypothetical protein
MRTLRSCRREFLRNETGSEMGSGTNFRYRHSFSDGRRKLVPDPI